MLNTAPQSAPQLAKSIRTVTRVVHEHAPSADRYRLGTIDAVLMDIRDLVRLRKAKDRMDREFDQPLDVPALARSAAMSTGHFSRSFKAAFGEGPYSYLMTRRIERAKALLRRGDMSVTDACFAVGCTS